MDQDPATPPSSGGSGKSGIFQNVNTVIAGLTGLVVAVGGLAAATKGVMWDKEPQKEERQALAAEPVAEPAAAQPAKAEEAPEQPNIYTGDLYDDEKFEGGAMSLKYNGENWILTADKAYEYEPIASTDSDRILAYNADYDSYLRWSVKGGVIEESTDRKKNWKPYAKVTAARPSSE